jgi:hypothetical protein
VKIVEKRKKPESFSRQIYFVTFCNSKINLRKSLILVGGGGFTQQQGGDGKQESKAEVCKHYEIHFKIFFNVYLRILGNTSSLHQTNSLAERRYLQVVGHGIQNDNHSRYRS